jgi:hypothetical protein
MPGLSSAPCLDSYLKNEGEQQKYNAQHMSTRINASQYAYKLKIRFIIVCCSRLCIGFLFYACIISRILEYIHYIETEKT